MRTGDRRYSAWKMEAITDEVLQGKKTGTGEVNQATKPTTEKNKWAQDKSGEKKESEKKKRDVSEAVNKGGGPRDKEDPREQRDRESTSGGGKDKNGNVRNSRKTEKNNRRKTPKTQENEKSNLEYTHTQ